MEEKIMSVILENCDDKIIYRNKDINLFETGLLDSMGFIELLAAFEEEFDIEIEPAEIKKERMSTPDQLVRFIENKLQ